MKSAGCVAGMEHAHCDEVGDDSCESGSDGEEEPAVSLPEFTESPRCRVRRQCLLRPQEDEAQPEIQREYCLGRGICGSKVDDYGGCERKVANEPPAFPEFNGVSDIVPHVGVQANESNLVRAVPVLVESAPQLPSCTALPRTPTAPGRFRCVGLHIALVALVSVHSGRLLCADESRRLNTSPHAGFGFSAQPTEFLAQLQFGTLATRLRSPAL
jgi:hypothetical protein